MFLRYRSGSGSGSGYRSRSRSGSGSGSRSRSGSGSGSGSRSRSRSPSRGSGSRSRSRSPSRGSGSRSRSRSPSRSRSRSLSPWESATRTHRGASTMRADHPNPESRAALEREFAELNRQHVKIMRDKIDMEKIANKLEVKMRRINDALEEFERDDALPTAVIHFVHLLEKANLYFQFKTSAKQRLNFEHCHGPVEVYRLLLQDEELMSDFPNIGLLDFGNAANAIYWEPFSKPTGSYKDPALSNWIYKLVYRALQADYVMDRDPEVELKKMMKNESSVYDRYFLIERLPAEYNNISKLEAYKKYSELVQSITTRDKEALEERQKSASTTSARDSEAFDQNRKVTSTAISARNKEAVDDEKA